MTVKVNSTKCNNDQLLDGMSNNLAEYKKIQLEFNVDIINIFIDIIYQILR